MKIKPKKTTYSYSTHKSHMDMILYEVRQNRKDILELKAFMNKSKGTISVLMFFAGIVGVFLWGYNYFK
jgi:hypothetical protein